MIGGLILRYVKWEVKKIITIIDEGWWSVTYYASVVHTDLFLTGGPGSVNEGNPYLCSSFILENWLEVPKCPFLGGAFWDYLKAHRLRKLSTNDYSLVEKVYIIYLIRLRLREISALNMSCFPQTVFSSLTTTNGWS